MKPPLLLSSSPPPFFSGAPLVYSFIYSGPSPGRQWAHSCPCLCLLSWFNQGNHTLPRLIWCLVFEGKTASVRPVGRRWPHSGGHHRMSRIQRSAAAYRNLPCQLENALKRKCPLHSLSCLLLKGSNQSVSPVLDPAAGAYFWDSERWNVFLRGAVIHPNSKFLSLAPLILTSVSCGGTWEL